MDGFGWLPLRPDEDFVPQLLAASRASNGLDCAGAAIAAAEVRTALLAVGEAGSFGLRLGDARITGPLDPQNIAKSDEAKDQEGVAG